MSSRFNCPNCGSLYEVVGVEPENVTIDRELACPSCGAQLQSRQGQFVLKYFLLERSHTPRLGARRSSAVEAH
jgi:predicted RNA-binding Zn-ribbon protein involved in translation (DUF1610 family)